jgi:hypothetical protein
MKSIFLVCLFAFISAQHTFSQSPKRVENLLLGNWSYKSGHYLYFDKSHKKLKQSPVSGIDKLNIQVDSSTVKIIYPNRVYNTRYNVSASNGKQFVTLNLGNGPVRYEISALSANKLTLQSRHNINFYVDGDADKRAAYSVFIINLAKNLKRDGR